MSIIKEQQQALDDAHVPREQRLQIGSCNYRLSTTFNPKEPTFEVALDFVDSPFEEEILTFIRELGYSGNIKLLSDVKVDILPQPWRTFGTITNKCLSGKVTGIDSLRLSRAQILWGLYHQMKVDYVYLLWEDLVFQIEKKESRRTKYMFSPRFTKVIINHFMSQDQSIPRRNKVDWNMANAMKESEAYKTCYAFATGKAIPKLKYVRRTTKEKTVQAPKASSGKRIKSAATVTRSGKKKQLAEGLETLSKIALSEAEHMKLAIKRSKTQLHSSQPSGSGAHERTSVSPGVPDVPTYRSDDEQISWKSSDEEYNDDESNIGKDEDDDDQEEDDDQEDDDDDQSDGDERIDSDNDGDDFVHPKLSTHNDEARKDDEVNEEDSFDPRAHTPSHVESTDDEESDEEIQGANVEEEEMDEEATNEEIEANELYRDVNINLVGRDTEMKDAPHTNIQTTQVIEDTHVIITMVNPEGQQQSSSVSSGFVSNMLNPSPDTGIDSIFNLNTESTSLVDVSVTAIAEPPLLSVITTPPPPTHLITHLQQTPAASPATVPCSSLRVQKSINEQLEAEVLTRSSTKSKTSHAVAANLSELELKKILIDKMESNKSIHISNEQKNLYTALVDAYESDKLLLDTYEDTVTFKRCRDDEDKDEEPSALSNEGSRRRRAGKEPESTSAPKEKTSKTTGKSTEGSKSHHKSADESAQAEEPMHTAKDLEEPKHQEFETGVTED
ncbi:hypothetical protein Tco_0010995 [Tanacetum coccineum]